MSAFNKSTELRIGDSVYARFFGEDLLIIEDIAQVASRFPHYLCYLRGEKYLIPKIHLSTRSLLVDTGAGNRRQLELL